MLHLLPIRPLLAAVVVLVGVTVLGEVYAGTIGTGDKLSDLKWVLHWSSTMALVLVILPLIAWRWIPLLQRFTFPYLGGEWAGKLEYQGSFGPGTRDVTLTVNHTLFRIAMIMDSLESISRTLVVHADHDPVINRDRLYYVYLNERKEGFAGAGQTYRGLAIIRFDPKMSQLVGNYFTEVQGSGTLQLKHLRPHSWWQLWK